MGSDHTIELLRLLADGASADQLELVPADPSVLELATRAARRLESQRGREQAWRALVDTASDLARASETGDILAAIVTRARALLGTDVAYLTLYDPERGDTYMRATAGAVAATFRSLRLDLGVGLGGLVASTHEAWWTSNYRADHRFEHTEIIDSGVGDEGLVAICGTPLLVGDEFVGVLFASYRREYTYSPDDVALLGSLGTLAAVTILQARARLATGRALAELSVAHEAERRHTDELERSADVHDRFTQIVADGGGVDDICTALVDVLGGWTVVLDAEGRRLSSVGPVPGAGVEIGDPDPMARSALLRKAIADSRGVSAEGRYAVAVRVRHEVLSILVCGGQEFTPLGWRIVERAGAVMSLLLLLQRDLALARQRDLAQQLSRLLAGTSTPLEAARILRGEGIDVREPFCLVVLRAGAPGVGAPGAGAGSLAMAVASAVAGRGMAAEYAHDVVALVTGGDPRGAAEHLARRVGRTGEVTAAGVGPLTGTAGIGQAHADAQRTVEAMIALGHRGRAAATADLGFAGLIVGSAPDVTAYVEQIIGPVAAYDAKRGTDLVDTLEAYFAAGRSPRAAAKDLHVHTNTVVQRLDRIAALLGSDWGEPERSLEVQLALRLRHLLPARSR